jgi:Alkylmercury lyase
MFRDESGRLTNVPSVETLRKAIKADQTSQVCSSEAALNAKCLLDHIGETVRGRIAEANLSPLENATRKYIIREFAVHGKPPTMSVLIKKMKLPSIEAARRIINRLDQADILTKEGGKIISAYPFSARTTRHRVVFKDGHEVYALCATDALGVHFMLHRPITVRSSCPACESEMIIEIKDGKVTSYSPTGIVQFVSSSGGCGCTAKTFCPNMNFFCSEEHAAAWREQNPALAKGELYSLRRTLEYGRHIFGSFLD